ncbi:MAG TPA: ABC transporter substrate-binding protein/permease, partial [Bdellovibrionota bacterium]|nr:ABC transporter substrate-binding protein/permease [Bdellovibrionota bacterium]
YYAAPDSSLKLVGAPIGEVLYGIGIRKTDTDLMAQVNAALKEMRKSGELRDIYDRWNLWNPLMASFFQDPSPTRSAPAMYQYYLANTGKARTWQDRVKLYWSFLPILGKGALTTLELSVLGMVLAVVWGLMLCLARLYGPKPLPWLSVMYIEAIRGTPLLIQLFFIFYALPHIGIKFTPFVAAVLGLGLNYAACEAENYRGGIQGIPKGQTEAAHALGMGTWQTLRYVLLPQALRTAIPPITNDFIALLKDSSLVSVITMVELTKIYGQLASTYFDFMGTGLLVAMVYLLLGLPFVRLARTLEKRLHAPTSGAAASGGMRRRLGFGRGPDLTAAP